MRHGIDGQTLCGADVTGGVVKKGLALAQRRAMECLASRQRARPACVERLVEEADASLDRAAALLQEIRHPGLAADDAISQEPRNRLAARR